jgi:hypothetical protein
MHLLGIGALEWSTPVTHVYRAEYVVWSLISSLICSMIAFPIALTGWRLQRRGGHGHGSISDSNSPQRPVLPPSQDDHRPRAPTPPSGVAIRSIQVAQAAISGEAPSTPRRSPRSGGGGDTQRGRHHKNRENTNNLEVTSSNSLTSETTFSWWIYCCNQTLLDHCAQRYKRDPSIRAQLLLSLCRMNFYFLVAAIILGLGSQICHSVLRHSLPPSISPEFNVLTDFFLSLLTSILYVPALLIVFYFFPASPVRIAGKDLRYIPRSASIHSAVVSSE